MSYRLMPYPLRHARLRQILPHLGFGTPRVEWMLKAVKRWCTVQIALDDRGWWIAYEGKPSTGPFTTKQQAVAWFANGGR